MDQLYEVTTTIAVRAGTTSLAEEYVREAFLASDQIGEDPSFLVAVQLPAQETNSGEWSGSEDPCDPNEFWIDDETGERVNATTAERTTGHFCPADVIAEWEDEHGAGSWPYPREAR